MRKLNISDSSENCWANIYSKRYWVDSWSWLARVVSKLFALRECIVWKINCFMEWLALLTGPSVLSYLLYTRSCISWLIKKAHFQNESLHVMSERCPLYPSTEYHTGFSSLFHICWAYQMSEWSKSTFHRSCSTVWIMYSSTYMYINQCDSLNCISISSSYIRVTWNFSDCQGHTHHTPVSIPVQHIDSHQWWFRE